MGHSNTKSAYSRLTFEELRCKLKWNFHTLWNDHWRDQVEVSGTGLFLRGLSTKPRFRTWASGFPRRVLSTMSRLRIGHVGVAGHLHRFNLCDSPLCLVCSVVDTVGHFLMDCSQYDAARALMLSVFVALGIPFTLQNVLGCGNFAERTEKILLRALSVYLCSTGRLETL